MSTRQENESSGPIIPYLHLPSYRASASANPQKCHMASLPTELMIQIINYLHLPALINLSQVNAHLRNLCHPSSLKAQAEFRDQHPILSWRNPQNHPLRLHERQTPHDLLLLILLHRIPPNYITYLRPEDLDRDNYNLDHACKRFLQPSEDFEKIIHAAVANSPWIPSDQKNFHIYMTISGNPDFALSLLLPLLRNLRTLRIKPHNYPQTSNIVRRIAMAYAQYQNGPFNHTWLDLPLVKLRTVCCDFKGKLKAFGGMRWAAFVALPQIQRVWMLGATSQNDYMGWIAGCPRPIVKEVIFYQGNITLADVKSMAASWGGESTFYQRCASVRGVYELQDCTMFPTPDWDRCRVRSQTWVDVNERFWLSEDDRRIQLERSQWSLHDALRFTHPFPQTLIRDWGYGQAEHEASLARQGVDVGSATDPAEKPKWLARVENPNGGLWPWNEMIKLE